METFTTAITEYTIRDGIVVGRDINLKTARTAETVGDSFDRLAEVTQGRRYPGLWDATSVPEFPPEVWRVFVDRIDKTITALAILVGPSTEKALGAFPKVIGSLLIPVRLFRDEDEAMNWLGQFV